LSRQIAPAPDPVPTDANLEHGEHLRDASTTPVAAEEPNDASGSRLERIRKNRQLADETDWRMN
jgi:hypothetical protein